MFEINKFVSYCMSTTEFQQRHSLGTRLISQLSTKGHSPFPVFPFLVRFKYDTYGIISDTKSPIV